MDITFERKALYEEVWTTPLTTLSKKYGLSDNGIRKICKAMEIPLPKAGHWAKVAAGHRIVRPPLSGESSMSKYVAMPGPKREFRLTEDEQWRREQIAFEENPSNLIVVEASPKRWHPALTELRAEFRESAQKILQSKKSDEQAAARRRKGHADAWSSDGYAWRSYQHDGQILMAAHRPQILRAGLQSYERGLRILNAISNAAVARSFAVSADQKEGRLLLEGHGGCVTLRITEKYSKEKGEYGEDRVPTEILRLFVGKYSFSEKQFSDESGKPLESQLNEIFLKVYPMIVLAREEAREAAQRKEEAAIRQKNYEETQARRKEEAARAELEKKRRVELVQDAENWAKANNIRKYVSHALTNSAPNSQMESWGQWALAVADQMDPSVRTTKKEQ